MTTPAEFLRAALDPVRLAILGAAAAGPVDVDDLAAALDTDRKLVLKGVGRLRDAGLLLADGSLDQEALRTVAESLPQAEGAASEIFDGAWAAEEAEILARFFSGDRLTSMPTQLAKRRVVLERLAQEFEVGERYPEKQVNFILQKFHADYAMVRRYLVDEGFLTRADGVYWRTGGRFDPEVTAPQNPAAPSP